MRRLVLAGFLLLAFPHAVAPLAAQVLTDFHLQWVWSQGGELLGSCGLRSRRPRRGRAVRAAHDRSHQLHRLLVHARSGRRRSRSDAQFSPPRFDPFSRQRRQREWPASHPHHRARLHSGARRPDAGRARQFSEPRLPQPGRRCSRYRSRRQIGSRGLRRLHLYVYDLLTGNAHVRNGFGCKEVALGRRTPIRSSRSSSPAAQPEAMSSTAFP